MRPATLALLIVLGGCDPGPASPPRLAGSATSRAGMVVTFSPYATEAGARILAEGGNAVDAAVAAAFALAVAEPTQSGLGGRTQMLLLTPDGRALGIDGTTEVPAGYDPASAPAGEHGHTAVGIPGTVAALTRAVAEHGSLPLSRVVAPALRLARDGIRLTVAEAERIEGVLPELPPGSPVAAAFAGPGGVPLRAGDVLVQERLAGVLERIGAEEAEGFYRGPVAEAIAADMEAHGGFVSLGDLAGYRARDAVVGRGGFGDLELVGSYLPASGVTVIEILRILERSGPATLDGARGAAALAEALLAGFEDREIAEPMDAEAAVAWLTSDTLAARRAAEIRSRIAGTATAGAGETGAQVGTVSPEPAFTTHVSVADTFGGVVALTQSLGPTMGARVLTPELGFLYASTLGGYLAGGGPGYRPWSSQAPLLALRDGEPVLVIGGAGARRILSALTATLMRVVEEGVPLTEALGAPRLHPTGGEVLVEDGWDVLTGLRDLGYGARARERSYFARLGAVERRADGTFVGAVDPRWSESAAAGPSR